MLYNGIQFPEIVTGFIINLTLAPAFKNICILQNFELIKKRKEKRQNFNLNLNKNMETTSLKHTDF